MILLYNEHPLIFSFVCVCVCAGGYITMNHNSEEGHHRITSAIWIPPKLGRSFGSPRGHSVIVCVSISIIQREMRIIKTEMRRKTRGSLTHWQNSLPVIHCNVTVQEMQLNIEAPQKLDRPFVPIFHYTIPTVFQLVSHL